MPFNYTINTLRSTTVSSLNRTLIATILCAVTLPGHTQETAVDASPELALINTKTLKEIVFYPSYSAPAKVESLNNSQISSRISALISSISPRVGDVVNKGQLLVTLDCTDGSFNRSSAQSRLQLARKEVNRLSKLKKASAVAEQSLNVAETDLTQANIAYKQATVQVDRCEISSPFSGIVTARQASVGELASPGTPLLSILDTGNLELVADISPNEVNSLKNAASRIFEWQNKNYPVTIRSIPDLINPTNRNRQARMSFNGRSALSGAAGRLRWSSDTAHVPADMLSERGGKIGLFVSEDNKARFIAINNARPGHPIAVDLPSNTLLITDGRFGLTDGDSLEDQGS